MNPALQNALRSGSLSTLGCIREFIVDGEYGYDFGGDPLPAWSKLSDEDQKKLVFDILFWHDDLTAADVPDLREVLAEVMR